MLTFQVVTFAYNLYLGHLRDPWKGITKEYNSEKGIYHGFGYGVP